MASLLPRLQADIFENNPRNEFDLKLFQTISAQQHNQNILISPLSVSVALAMTCNGAAGATESEIRKVLGLDDLTDQEINLMYRDILSMFNKQQGSQIIELANSIWIDKGFPVRPEFIDINREYFYSQVTDLDFSHPDASRIINQWVSQNTQGKITDLLDSSIDPAVVMYLINSYLLCGTMAI